MGLREFVFAGKNYFRGNGRSDKSEKACLWARIIFAEKGEGIRVRKLVFTGKNYFRGNGRRGKAKSKKACV